MHLLRKISILFILLVFSHTSFAQNNLTYMQAGRLLLTSPGAFQYGLLGFVNPAVPAFVPKFEAQAAWNTVQKPASSLNSWGVFAASRGLGTQIFQQKIGSGWVTDYGISTAFSKETVGLGIGYRWSKATSGLMPHDRALQAGLLLRPNRFLSVGATGHVSLERDYREGALEAAVRPLGSPVLTLFADAATRTGQSLKNANWSTGAVVQVLSGIHLIGRYFDDHSFTAGLSFNFGRTGMSGQARFSDQQALASNSTIVRLGGLLESVFTGKVQKKTRYVRFWPKGPIVYHMYRFGDKNKSSFFDLLKNISASANDPRVTAVVVNFSGTRVQPEHAWEIREALRKAQKKGKKVIVFVENANISLYHLASVADWVVMDPLGSLTLEGFVMGRTFYKGTLEKLGIGFDELRFFTYKSAVEVFSREKMSEADRAQRQAYVDDWYDLVKLDITRSRKMTPEKFDGLVNENFFFLADSAQKVGLVDTLARWTAIDDVVKDLLHKKIRPISAKKLIANEEISDRWGAMPKIALVYALGSCAMDNGIRARWLEKVFKKLEKTKSVKAVVFRVDSPGGDGMASDLVAEAMKSCSKKKPVIVSQGQVAGSGGYWISMNADTIVAGPNTITGSIGVIGGWIYDKGFSGKIGFTADHVKRGKHADAMFGISIPYLGTLPERDLTPDERATAEHFMKTAYNIFVKKVAAGRSLPLDSVKQIAQGHFYSGVEGKKIGLVDVIGGLEKAVQIAKKKAGLRPDEKVEIVEIPKYKGLFKSPLGSLPFAGVQALTRAELDYIKMVSQMPGKPLFLMPPGSFPTLH